MFDLTTRDIKFISGVGPQKAAVLNKELEIYSLYDLIYYFPYKLAQNQPISLHMVGQRKNKGRKRNNQTLGGEFQEKSVEKSRKTSEKGRISQFKLEIYFP